MKIPFARIAVLSFVGLGAVGFAQEAAKPAAGTKKESPEKKAEAAKEIAVTGEVVNLACPLFAASSAGAKHACGPECLKGRAWAGLLDEKNGDLFVALGKDQGSAAERLATWAGQRVTIKGKATEGKGLRALQVGEVAKAEGTAPAGAPVPTAREGTITGSVVNVLCALHPASNGDRHACDAKCLEGEQVLLGIRDDLSGKIYVAFAPMHAGGHAGGEPKGDAKGPPTTATEVLRPLAGAKAWVTGRIVGNLIEVTKAEKA